MNKQHVNFSAVDHHRLSTGTTLLNLTSVPTSSYTTLYGPGVKTATFWRKSNTITITLPCHTHAVTH